MREGPNVDVVANSHQLPFPQETFDTVVCVEMLEHDDAPWLTAAESIRVLKPGGRLIACAPGISFPRHDFPCDYWRFTADGLRALFGSIFGEHRADDRDHAYFVGRR